MTSSKGGKFMGRGIRMVVALGVTVSVLGGALTLPGKSSREDSPRLPALRHEGWKWYKGNLHTHSYWSDGDDFPEMIADWYKRHGYHFLALSDHNVLSEGEQWMELDEKRNKTVALKKYQERFGSSWVEQREVKGKKQVRLKPLSEFRSLLEEAGKYLLIPAEEITHRYAKLPVHMNAINLRDVIKPVDGGNVRETISVNHRLVAEQEKKARRPILAFLNHPNFGWGVNAEDMVLAEELRLFEVYNGHPGVRNEGDGEHPSCEQLWDIVLALRLGRHGLGVAYGLATDDAHGYHTFGVGKVNPGRGWVMVRAPYLSAEGIVRAMTTGDFYFSTGVMLDEVRVTPEEITLTIRPERGVHYRTEFVATMKDAPLDSSPRLDKEGKVLPVTRVYNEQIGKVVEESTDLAPRYRLTGKERYVRARVISSKFHPNPYKKGDVEMAWTQPAVPREGK